MEAHQEDVRISLKGPPLPNLRQLRPQSKYVTLSKIGIQEPIMIQYFFLKKSKFTNGEEKVLSYNRMPVNQHKGNDGIRKL